MASAYCGIQRIKILKIETETKEKTNKAIPSILKIPRLIILLEEDIGSSTISVGNELRGGNLAKAR